MTPSLFKSKKVSPGLWLNLLPIPVMATIIAVELYCTPNMRVTPPLSVLSLAAFALVLSPRVTLMWVILFSVPVLWSQLEIHSPGDFQNLQTVSIRTILFFVVGAMAVAISAYRHSFATTFNRLLEVFDVLPTPLAVSDLDGNILFVNDACCRLLGHSRSELSEMTYFSVFPASANRGRSVQNYVSGFSKKGVFNMPLVIQSPEGTEERQAVCYSWKIDSKELMITQIQERRLVPA